MKRSSFCIAVFVVLLAFSALSVQAQQQLSSQSKYWIFFKDKLETASKVGIVEPEFVSEKAVARRQLRGNQQRTDLDVPVSRIYLDAVKKRGIEPIIVSRWFNAVSAVLNAEQVKDLAALPMVKEIKPVTWTRSTSPPPPDRDLAISTSPGKTGSTKLDYGDSITQLEVINAITPLENGINGTGVRLGFLDTEYGDFQHRAFTKLVTEGRLIATENFTGGSQSNRHGRSVASVAVGFEEGELIGPAYGAEVLAATTEWAPSETNQEEDNFVAGIEWLERNGADVITTSLGYNLFDAGQRSYTISDLDGDTGITTRAADLAVSLGVVVVTSAGNEGDDPWRLITTPADGDSVIAVGAVTQSGLRTNFSSVGPTADGRIKPDVAAMGSGVRLASFSSGYNFGNGTSFSAPIVAAVACQMLQVNPDLTPIQVRDILKNTASQANSPDNNLGWGIIDANAAIERARDLASSAEFEEANLRRDLTVAAYPNPFQSVLQFEVQTRKSESMVRLDLYNLLGQHVANVFDGTLRSGVKRLEFNAGDFPAGVYFYRIQSGQHLEQGHVVLVR